MKILRKSIVTVVISIFVVFFSTSLAYGHGGGLDSDGGHNCNVGSCAGTYHCHQAWGPGCGGGSISSSNTISPKCINEYDTTLTKRNWAKIQKSLKDFGYSPGKIDGRYGPKTKKALKDFERDNELESSVGININYETLLTLGVFCK